MFRRILFSTVAAAAVASAAPALAGESAQRADERDVPACCARAAAMHERAHARASEDAAKAAQEPKREARRSFESNPADYQYMFDYQGG